MGKKVLIAVDESEHSERAVRWASDHVVQPTDEVVLLHSQAPSRIYAGPAGTGGYYLAPQMLESIEKYNKEHSALIVENAKKICDEKQIKGKMMVAYGDPRETICETVEKVQADVLVMGSHSYGPIKRAFLGSVSDYCVHNAKCNVLIVKD